MRGLIIDNFAGGGGASTGLEQALGRPVDVAINHDPDALAMHAANHPQTEHHCESVWAVNPREICAGRTVDVAWFSPDCKHFSRAKGGKPVEKAIRGLAWVVFKWAALPKGQRPRVIFLENVMEFTTWGPLTRTGRPIKAMAGQTFDLWCDNLRGLGYQVEWRMLRACDYGAPTIRKRFFLIARMDGQPIAWPEPSHGDPKMLDVAAGVLKPWRTAADIIDFSIPCPSIFTRKRPLAENTMRRIALGIQRYVIDAKEPFIVHCQNASNKSGVNPTSEPLRTITASPKGGGMAVCVPSIMKVNHAGERYRGGDVTEPLQTLTAKNGTALVSAFLAQHNTGVVGRKADAPLSTITARGTQQNLVTSNLVKLRGACRDGQAVTTPMPTLTAGGNPVGEVRAFLIKYYGCGVGQGVTAPLHTITTRDRYGLVMIHGEPWQVVDIGMRMLTPRELFNAQGFPPDYIIDVGADGQPVTKTVAVGRCGNAVPPVFSRALADANCGFAKVQDLEAVG
ncbi:MAG: hypothetical protein COB49_01875 [Alphaproteobacteria bacterium]|nr:MAG: hypothetical protein COB49_01875 [Alphaproteobacteria bacterium]